LKETDTILSKLSLALFFLLACLPLLLGIAYALAYSLGLTGLLSEGFSFKYFLAVITSESFYSSVWYSFRIAACSLLLAFIPAFLLSTPFIYLPRRNPPLWFYLPLSLPPLVMALIFFVLLSAAGWLSSLAAGLGFIDVPEQFPSLVNDSFGWGIIITHIFLIAPFLSLLFVRIALQERLHSLYALARTLGSGKLFFIVTIWLPILIRRGLPVFWLYFIFCFGMYEVALVNGVSYPQAFSVLVAEKLSRFDLATRPEGYAMALIYCVAIITISVFVFRKRKFSV
jgi:putative spermidine/putrescine transport system permease protein